MTTTVTVEAHCSENLEVTILISNDGNEVNETHIIQNGEKWTGYVHDAKSIHVCECKKKS